MPSFARALAVVLVLASLPACYSYRTASAPMMPDQHVRVRYASPQTVPVTALGESMPIEAVRQLTGRVQSDARDGIRIQLSSARDFNRVISRRPRGASVLVMRGPGTTVEVMHIDKGRTAGLVAVSTVLVGWTIGLMALGASGN